ncbi:ABC transporter ATP-binding protein [Bacillus sp. Marseille-P3661]|uniref:ABC transporter ATP-binding protein n=1 Tax=Bacillus sp. Marseille-P3661 TaxID=1936234 RepID=UPI0015E18C8B|nr:ABC transporter ATP-binding protein [Bacillus sp. Marseille-P3661]
MTTSVLKIKGLTKQLKKSVIGPIDFQMEKGTAVALIGANGSGKSTFLRLLMNILKPDKGDIQVFGQKFAENETTIKQQIGYMGDLFEPFGYLSIKELSSLVSYWYPSWSHSRYADFLRRYNIDETMKYSKCSKGTKKKVEFIFSLCHNPQLLLLDEPSAGVDIISQRKMKEDLKNYMEDGENSILLVTHIMDEVKQICDYITIIEEGMLVHYINKDEIYENWARVWVSTVTDSLRINPNVISIDAESLQILTNNLRAIEKAIKTEGIAITHIQRPTLEETIENLVELKEGGFYEN